MAETNSTIDIPDTELMALCREIPTIVPEQERIQILNELTGLLAKDKELLNPSELLEHEAQLHLLKLHCTLLAITYKDLWQVKAQLISIGTELISGENRFVLPYSVSKIFDIIKSSKIKKTAGQYLLALQEIQGIAQSYESDWYTWARNQVSFLASAPSVKEFLATILAIDLGPSTKKSTPVEDPDLLTSVFNYGLSFFSPLTPDEKDTSTKGWELTL